MTDPTPEEIRAALEAASPVVREDLVKLVEIMDTKAKGERNSMGDLWLDFWCHDVARAIERMALRTADAEAQVRELVEALERVLRRDENQTCPHDETYRGGNIWEICHSCGAKWADDEGGKPEWHDPQEWDIARALISRHKETSNG